MLVVNHADYGFSTPIQEVDYFHGEIDGYVIAEMCCDEIDVRALDMLHANGCFAKAVRYIQRLFRTRRDALQIIEPSSHRV